MNDRIPINRLHLNRFDFLRWRLRGAGLAVGLATLSLALAQDPWITVQPTNQIVSLGGTATFRVAVTTTNYPLSFRWRYSELPAGTKVDLPGATRNPLQLTNVASAQAGYYSVIASNAIGDRALSDEAQLIIDPTFIKITTGPLVGDLGPWSGWSSWGDFDADGLLDVLVIANWDSSSPGRVRNAMYRNLGGDSFVRVTNAATTNLSQSWCGAWADFDNNGTLDLFVVHPGARRNELFRNDGEGGFTSVTCAATATTNHSGAAWVDLDRDGLLDLLVTTANIQKDFFFRGHGDGTFTAWTADEVGPLVETLARTGAPTFCDIDGDGDEDLYVANWEGRNYLYRNDGTGRLEPVSAGSLPASAATGSAVWADLNNDGLFDLLTTGYTAATDTPGVLTLHRNLGAWVFEDATVAAGLTSPVGAWGLAVGDFDNDGDLDIYFPNYAGRDVLYVNRGDGTFTPVDVGSPLTDGINDGAVWVDYNNDGFLDLFKTCGDVTPARNLLYRNSLMEAGNTNRWLLVRLVGTVSNRSAIGARVWVQASIQGKQVEQVRQIQSAVTSAAGLSGLAAHFGLGDATKVDLLRIEWPSGIVQELTDVAANQFLTVTETQNPPGPQPQVTSCGCVANGAFELTVSCTPNSLRYVLEASTDLAQWIKVQVRTNSTGTMEFTDSFAGNQAVRFYRVVAP